jgi:hypothetical protein
VRVPSVKVVTWMVMPLGCAISCPARSRWWDWRERRISHLVFLDLMMIAGMQTQHTSLGAEGQRHNS